jgi:hypothetical protein
VIGTCAELLRACCQSEILLPYQRVGYVFWNLERLTAPGILQNDWEVLRPAYVGGSQTVHEAIKSWEVRSGLYQAEIRGVAIAAKIRCLSVG